MNFHDRAGTLPERESIENVGTLPFMFRAGALALAHPAESARAVAYGKSGAAATAASLYVGRFSEEDRDATCEFVRSGARAAGGDRLR
ncbi:MAG: hypothetical protein K0R38_5528 [Polyangiaceae bacterium]|nr:hypothetical protein [Polyangiaceae bacterium]